MKSVLSLLLVLACLPAAAQHQVLIRNATTRPVSFVQYDEFGNYHHHPVAAGKEVRVEFESPFLNLFQLENDRDVPYFFFPGDEATISNVSEGFLTLDSRQPQREKEWRASTLIFQAMRKQGMADRNLDRELASGHSLVDSVFRILGPDGLSGTYRQLVQEFYRYHLLGLWIKDAPGDPSLLATFWKHPFQPALQSYVLTFRTYVLRYLPGLIPQEKLLDHLSQTFSGHHREVALYTTLHMAYYRNRPWFRSQYPHYTALSRDPVFQNRLALFQRTDEVLQKAGSVVLMDPQNDTVSLNKLLEQRKGKVVLIDLWASWCIPCLEQLPFSEGLVKTFEGKAFELLYLNLDREPALFAAASRKYLPGRSSYQILGNFESSFARINGVKTLPRYLLIDKQGTIVDPDAPVPENAQLKKLIEKYL